MKRILDNQALYDRNKKCELLMELGFEIYHSDSHVGMAGIDFDFSATAGDVQSILLSAINQTKEASRKAGIQSMRAALKDLILGDDE